MGAVLLVHLVVGGFLLVAGDRVARRGAWIGLAAPLITLVWLLTRLPGVVDGRVATEQVDWVAGLGLSLDLRLDAFAAVMVLLASGVGVLVFAYAASYFSPNHRDLGRLLGLLVLFAGAMVGLVLADNLLVLYGFWELTSVTSFLLIGHDHRKAEARAAALHALLVTSAGALAMLCGFIVLGEAAGTYRLSAILAAPPSGTAVAVAIGLILVGAFAKSAQVPFHAWLPGAMVAPTPISAFLHSATMVKAGVYLIARLSPAFGPTIGWFRPVVVSVGVATMVLGGLRALRRNDLKLLLAFGTISQLGLMVALFGIGTAEAMAAGVVVLLAHGAFKCANFMVVGVVDHQYGTRDLRCLPRLDSTWAAVGVATVVGAASMAGIPPLLGFVSKEAALEALVNGGGGTAVAAAIGVTVGSVLTVAYSIRFAWGVLGFGATAPIDAAPAKVAPLVRFVLPALVLTALTVVVGIVPSLLDSLDQAAEEALTPLPYDVHLSLWHGLTTALGLSVVAVLGGVALFVGRSRVQPLLAVGHRVPGADATYAASIRVLNRVADQVTGRIQTGSLPMYAGVILTTAALLPLWGLTTGASWPGWPDLIGPAAYVPISAVLIGAALAAAAVRRRFSAALFLGVAGYAMAALFVVQGAPDLALTQVAIETLTTVLFVLVLRRLPERFGASTVARGRSPEDQRARSRERLVRLGVAAVVGVSVFVVALSTGSGTDPVATPVSDEMIEQSLPEGHGRNVVNVILVDMRAFDTLGELTVLVSGAIGTVALARAGRRPGGRRDAEGGAAGTSSGASGGAAPPRLARLPRMITLDVSVRVVFALVMVGSLYLLFAGHNQPGGGFVGGILAGAAVALRYISGGISQVRSLSRGRPWIVMGAGLLLAVVTAIVPLVLGGAVLQTGYTSLAVPVLGSVALSSAMVFDLGVYLAVFGLALMVFESFGDDPVSEQAR